jgi:hypothetical protein
MACRRERDPGGRARVAPNKIQEQQGVTLGKPKTMPTALVTRMRGMQLGETLRRDRRRRLSDAQAAEQEIRRPSSGVLRVDAVGDQLGQGRQHRAGFHGYPLDLTGEHRREHARLGRSEHQS